MYACVEYEDSKKKRTRKRTIARRGIVLRCIVGEEWSGLSFAGGHYVVDGCGGGECGER